MCTHNLCFELHLEKHHNSFLSHLLIARCNIGVQLSVRPSVSLSVCQSTIYVKVLTL